MESMYYIGLDVHKKTISYCVKDASGRVLQEGRIGATRGELDSWMKTLPQPWSVAMEATIFTRKSLRIASVAVRLRADHFMNQQRNSPSRVTCTR